MFLTPSKKLNFNVILDNFDIIRKEYLTVKENNKFLDYTSVANGTNDLIKNPVYGNYQWQVYPLWFRYSPWQGREDSYTVEILKMLNINPVLATFSKLTPNSELPWHQDHDEAFIDRYDTTVIKYHLTLDAPGEGDSVLEFENERRILKEGDLNIFDESNSHRASNESDKDRGVLIVSFLRTDLY